MSATKLSAKILPAARPDPNHPAERTGLSGFTKRSESPYDPFGAAHFPTSISAALGFKVAADPGRALRHSGPWRCDRPWIGDGAMSAAWPIEGR